MLFHIILYQPEIPPNTGNILRLSANTGAQLHLIHPLGFSLNDKQLKRAGLDYQKNVDFFEYDHFRDFRDKFPKMRLFSCSTKGKQNYSQFSFQSEDGFLFGPETRGLPDSILNDFPQEQILRVPMLPKSRSLNLSNTVAILLYEAYRQNQFEGLV
jgi:tRNA (cytidine/uridine-2'-O-)-methyltransferase